MVRYTTGITLTEKTIKKFLVQALEDFLEEDRPGMEGGVIEGRQGVQHSPQEHLPLPPEEAHGKRL